ncbi:MAG TPA: urease accessory protein UreE [Polyangiaceae bacterium]|nr:urease accessory protein UreE [Polyangiaceae bacterium]
MRSVRSLHKSSLPPDGRILLDYDARTKSRFRAHLEGGEEIAVKLPRGTVLADGDRLLADDGGSFEVVAADEDLSVATTSDPLLLARATYHLGNRHVPLEIGIGRLAFQHDHVLDEMVRRLGLTLGYERAPFAPEGGVYAHGTGSSHHDHAHHDHGDHDPVHHHHDHHDHAHDHGHDHAHKGSRS